MLKEYNSYFWDSPAETFSEEFRLRRILEYASFPALIKYPFEHLKNNLNKIDINSLRTSFSRKKFILLLKPYILSNNNWNEAIKNYINDCFSFVHKNDLIS